MLARSAGGSGASPSDLTNATAPPQRPQTQLGGYVRSIIKSALMLQPTEGAVVLACLCADYQIENVRFCRDPCFGLSRISWRTTVSRITRRRTRFRGNALCRVSPGDGTGAAGSCGAVFARVSVEPLEFIGINGAVPPARTSARARAPSIRPSPAKSRNAGGASS